MHEPSSSTTRPDAMPGHRLRQLRHWANVSADQVWRAAGISPRLLEMYESGAMLPTPGHLAALAQCLGVPLAVLGGVMPLPSAAGMGKAAHG